MSTTPPPSPATGLPAQYRPAEHEARVRAAWEGSGAFHADPGRVLRGEAEPFCILIPPPNVTAALHLGHAFNNTLQDVLVRAHRMMGFETLWMPGTDHAGIATQAVVERRLREEGVLKGPLRDAMSREEFVGRAQAWKDEYEARILEQLKAMGCSCDWARTRFTMDEVCARAVREAFFRLFKAGLIYRGKRLVNWDPVLQTAVADDELEDREVEGKFYYLRYPLVERVEGSENPDASLRLAKRADWRPVEWSELAARGYPGAGAFPEDQPAWVTVATTRPETYLGDTAVAVNPKDPRAVALRGLMVELPLVGRVIPIVEDDYVVMPDPEGEDPKAKYATGFLKVTPAHDENDYALYQRHKPVMDEACGGEGRALINIMAPDASISDKHGWGDADEVKNAHVFVGRSREEARDLVIREFQAHEIGTETLLERIRPYTHTVPYSDRSKVPIEPWLSDQWYVKVTDDRLRGEAQRALAAEQRTSGTFPPRTGEGGDGGMRFHPDRYAKSYESWHANLRDWCVSRQLWWGQ
ncbi:MAG: class I tRNA ligase family protein, partial [Phycisphaerales bacterium]|nr:class I tRNA ligase family protein [Phycisphaerales bacterium]